MDLTLCQMVFVIIGVEVVSRKHPSSVVDCRIFGICKNRTKQKGYNLHKTKHFDGKAKLKFCILNAANVHQWTPQFMNLKENATAYHKGGALFPFSSQNSRLSPGIVQVKMAILQDFMQAILALQGRCQRRWRLSSMILHDTYVSSPNIS